MNADTGQDIKKENAISLTNVRKTFDGNDYVLQGINLQIPKGSITVIIGFSGAGKSVLTKHLLGLIKPTEGEVEVLGQRIDQMDEQQITKFRCNFGVLFQNAALFDDMSALENVCFPLVEHRKDLSRKQIVEIATSRLVMVGLDPKHHNKNPSALSGGMRKRVGLARAIALDPEILIYDEPTTGLDPIMTEMVDNLILSTHKHREGITSLVVSHDLYAAFRIGDYIAMLDGGKILLFGTPKDFMESKIELVHRFVSKGILRQ